MNSEQTYTIALAGNPNVGKSTIFNALTKLHQHTGNWSGKTVACASGQFLYREALCHVVDLPGIYSLRTHSEEEEIAKDYICSGNANLLLVVCDATCLERGLHLLKQITKLDKTTLPSIILCVNLCDEAAKKGITVDFLLLSELLQIPVIPCMARKHHGLDRLKEEILTYYTAEKKGPIPPCSLCCDSDFCPFSSMNLHAQNITAFSPEQLSAQTVVHTKPGYRKREDKIDRLVTGPFFGTAIMLLLLAVVFWLTITGANYPSAFLWEQFYRFEQLLAKWFQMMNAPLWLTDVLVYGVFRVVAWIVSVMLPPMAIFFPLFTLLEDLGYLPRVAFNMDCAFKRCHACGKQCLTMAMGLGCNAAGVVGCRIIDSPRERLIAILTNSLVPCNGRFPTLLMLITLFFMGSQSGGGTFLSSAVTAMILTGFILLGIGGTLFSSWLLSKTILKGMPSSFTLELPPYRMPQFGKVIIRSVFDRTLFVLGRALVVAAPAGLLIWAMANLYLGDQSILWHLAAVLDPFGRFLGMDGIILVGFILGFPANEIVVPIILMAYLQTGHLVEMSDSSAFLNLFLAHGWTVKTALCMAVFSLFHWPCSTTCLTIKKETGSIKWTVVAFLLPTVIGILLCSFINFIF